MTAATITLDGKQIELKRLVSRGAEIPDPLETLLAMYPNFHEFAMQSWVESEFNLPLSMRQLCDSCFIRVIPHEQWLANHEDGYFKYNGIDYKLHMCSSELVLNTAPLVGVSCRFYNGEYFAVAHYWQPKDERRVPAECQANTTKGS